MKKPKDIKELIHQWAHGAPDAKCGNVFHKSGTLYSYGHHFPVARIVEIEGAPVALFNPDRYSVSTSKHQSFARGAAWHLPCHYIPISLWDTIRDAATLASAIAQAREAATARAADERRQKNEQAREARAAKKFAALAFPEQLATWRAGGRLFPGSHFGPVYLRLVGDTIETSRGARVPLSDALALYRALAPAAGSGRGVALPELSAGHYRGVYLRGGVVTIGCHNIPWTEIEAFAGQHSELLATPEPEPEPEPCYADSPHNRALSPEETAAYITRRWPAQVA